MAPDFIFLVIVALGMLLAARGRKVTWGGAVMGGLLSVAIMWGSGYTGFTLLVTFFLLGTAATGWKRSEKSRVAGRESSRRTAGQVFANAGVPALLALLAILMPQHQSLFKLMVAASFSSATADTLSSELGIIYGRRFYNIWSFKKDQRGLDGVISVEGTLLGIAGSLAICAVYALQEGTDHTLIWILVAGTVGNLTDSLLGAVLERKNMIGNNTVNFLNTLVAALVVLLLSVMFAY